MKSECNNLSLPSSNRVLIAPLNWGLGHATRSIPIIKYYLQNKSDITVASDGIALRWLKNELGNQVKYLELPGYDVNYNSNNMSWNIIRQYPKINRAIRKEKSKLDSYIKSWTPNLIISDNRYGIYGSEIKSVLLTHQLSMLYANGVTATAFKMQINKWIKPFDECWVPDYADHRLSGLMSHSSMDLKFIGPLSRFTPISNQKERKNITVVLSGPEPQRTKLEASIGQCFKNTSHTVNMVRGTDQKRIDTFSELQIIDLADTDQLQKLFEESALVITRSGYSSIMDFDILSIPVIMIPTPGQKEQEYLCELHAENQGMKFIRQNEIQKKLPFLIDQILS